MHSPLTLLLLAGVVGAVPRDRLYPFGTVHSDNRLPPSDEISSPEIELTVPVHFFDEQYSSLYVSINGLVSFLTEIPAFYNMPFPLDYPVIAPLYTDVDTRAGGTVFYRETQEPALLTRASDAVSYSFNRGRSFQASSLFIATWVDVGYYDQGSDKANTFQVVIASDASSSYVFLLYADQGVQWIQSKGKGSRPDARAQAGIMAHDGRIQTLRGSGTDQVKNLDKWTNSDEPGQWLFFVGPISPTENVSPPDVQVPYVPLGGATTCSYGAAECHSKAECVNHPKGFCCICQDGYYGNGKNCLQDDIPLRVNGKVTGTLNGIRLEELDLQGYVVTNDGRTYTAISKVSEQLGFDMQSLNVLGTTLSWLFAKPIKSSKNGYELTGGVYNHTTEVFFTRTGHRVTVVQKFMGLDVFDQLRTEISVSGTIPSIGKVERVEAEDFEEKYSRTSPGVVKAHYTREIVVGGNKEAAIQFTVDQTIEFEECSAQESDVTTLRLKLSRNYILYEENEKIVRYAMSSKITPLGDDDPCKESKLNCGEHSTCLVENDDAKCVCDKGYQFLYDDGASAPQCVDVNECQTGQHHCNHNAICVNEPGSYKCQCKSGFLGDGYICERMPSCKEAQCHPDAECFENKFSTPECRCRAGFRGDGLQCTPENTGEACNIAHNCSPFATCKFNERSGSYSCVCVPGYNGDGYSCESPAGYRYIDPAAPNPDCDQDECRCPEGFVYGREVHRCLVDASHSTTNDHHEQSGPDRFDSDEQTCNENHLLCHVNARCVFKHANRKYECQCNSGYEGDGHDCSEIDYSCMDVDICHVNATCVLDPRTNKHVCSCNEGYEGDGTTCYSRGDCQTDSQCGRNAQCVYEASTRLYRCVCNQGFRGDGRLCEDDQEVTCRECHSNAECVFLRDLNQYRCECLSGYRGDGRLKCEKEKSGCNVANDCGRNAECRYNPYDGTHKCTCRDGFIGDGYWCLPQTTCDQDGSICHDEAKCDYDEIARKYVCRCNDGFIGDGFDCKPSKSHEGDFLLVNQGMATLRIPFKPSYNNKARIIQIHYFQTAVGIDIDCQEGRVYWSDVNGKAIRSSEYNGANSSRFSGAEIESPEGLAIDWVSRNVFWTDSALNHVAVASLDALERRKVLFSEDLINPRGIALYPAQGRIFWSDWNRENPKIEMANMDGSDRSVFVRDNIQLPNSLAVDAERNELCWADAGTKKIECIELQQHFRRVVASELSYPFSLAISPTHYYWTDWVSKKVEVALRPGGERQQALNVPLGSSGNLFGAVVVPNTCPVIYSACQSPDACPDGYLCLPKGRGGRSCLCPEDLAEDSECNDLI